MLRSIARLLIAVSTAIPILAQAPSYDLEFVRKGGTIVMLGNPSAMSTPGALPFPLALALLVATSGKGRFIYTSITFPQQIANGVPGAMRLFINLLSAGLPIERVP